MKTLNLPEFVNSKGEDVILDWKDDKQAVTKETKASVLVSYKDGKGNTVVNSTDPNTPHLIKSDGAPALLYHYTITLIKNPKIHPGAGYILPGVRGLSLLINVYTFKDYTEYIIPEHDADFGSTTDIVGPGISGRVPRDKLHDFLKVFIANEANCDTRFTSSFSFYDLHGFVRVYPETGSEARDLPITNVYFYPQNHTTPKTDQITVSVSNLIEDNNTIEYLLKSYTFQIIDKGGDLPVIDNITVYVSVHST